MSAWTGSLQPSPVDPGGAVRSTPAPRTGVPERALIAFALASLALGFGLHQGLGAGSGSPPAKSAVRAHSYSRAGLLSLPLAAQGPVSAALGRDQAAYRIAGLTAHNPAQGFSARFGRSGVTITAGSARFAISLQAFGRGRELAALAPVSPVASADRVSYARGSLSEWWANGPLGLEQGFDIARRPTGSGALALSVAVPAGAHLDHGALMLPGGLRYAGLHATDAQGHALPAWLQLSSGGLQLRVDDRRAIYPVRIDPFVQAAALTSSDGAAGDLGGRAVAISGNTIVVGAETHTVGPNQGAGAVYVFTEPSGGWANATQTAELTATEATSGHEHHLGNSVGISGNTIVAGAPGAGPHPSQGAAYVFVKPEGEWKDATQTAELIGSDGAEGDATGYEAVAISGSTVVMGARSHSSHGALYVFTEPGGGWAACPLVGGVNTCAQTAKLTVSTSTELGVAVSISENTIAALGQGDPAYVFVKPGGAWADATKATAELTASSGPIATDGTAQIAISGNTLVEGSWQGNALYVFEKPAGEWANATTETAELTASDGTSGNDLGFSVAIEGETIVAGAPQQEEGTNGVQGAVYTYAKPSTGWANAMQTQELTTSGGVKGELLGWDVAVGGETIVGGAPERKVGANSRQGTAYVFATPESIEKLRGSGGAGGTGTASGTGSSGATGSGSSSATGSSSSTGAGAATGKGSPDLSLPSLASQLGLPSAKACVSQRKLTIHVAEHIAQAGANTKIKSAEVLLDGHVVAKLKGSDLVAHVSLVGLAKGSFKITVKATTTAGKTLSASATFHTCARSKHKRK
jgi:hypothetical protein